MTTRYDIVDEARTWIGTPYHHQARLRGVGVDCIGLVGGVALALALPGADAWAREADLHNYARTPDPALLRDACARYFDRVTNADARMGDVLLFALDGQPRHFAILVSEYPRRIVHAYALLAARAVVEQSLPIARATWIATYRFRGVDA